MTRRWFHRQQSLPKTTLSKTTMPETTKLARNAVYGKMDAVSAYPPELLLQATDTFQLDLATAVVRIEQIRDELGTDPHWLLDRLFTCDLPRLRSYLTPEAIGWINDAKRDD